MREQESEITWKNLLKRLVKIFKIKLQAHREKSRENAIRIIVILIIVALAAIVMIPGIFEKIIELSLYGMKLAVYTMAVIMLFILKLFMAIFVGFLALLYILLAVCFIATIFLVIAVFVSEILIALKPNKIKYFTSFKE